MSGFSLSPCTFPPFVLIWEVGLSRSLLPLLQFLELLLKLKLTLTPLTCQTSENKPKWGFIILHCSDDALRRPRRVARLSSVDAALFFSKQPSGGGIVFSRTGETA